MKIVKKALKVLATVLALAIIAFCFVSIMLNDQHINGFVGTAGIVRAKLSGQLYTVLDDDPIKMLIRQDSVEEFLNTYFDEVNEIHWSGQGIKDNTEYSFKMSAFTGQYFVVRIAPE